MNKVILIGRLTRDPEPRTTTTGKAVTSFTLAVDRRFVRRDNSEGQQTADFIPIVAWNKLADICANNLSKGRRISVEGRISVRSYDDQNGNKRYVTEVIADEVEFLDSKNSAGGEGSFQKSGYSKGNARQSGEMPDDFSPSFPDEDGEEVPF